jgi:hypothetical protein
MAYITPTNPKWATWYDVSQALQERTGDYTQANTQYATKAYIIANFDNIHLEKLNTTNNSIGISYLNTQFVKWADVEAIEYVFYIDTVGNTAQTVTKDYYAYSQTFVIYSYKNIYKNGTLVTSNIPVAWHYNSSQTGWTTNSPTGGTASATTITLAIPENKTTAQINYNWSAIQNEGRTSGAKSISIQFQHKAKYGTIAWNPSGDISVVSTATTVDKGIVVTGNFNDNISDSQGTDAANILTAVTITTSETWVTGITFSLTNSNYKFPMWTSETTDRVTTITLTVNDPRLTLSGPSTFKITQKMRVVTFDNFNFEFLLNNPLFGCMGGTKNYKIISTANMYYDGTLQNVVNMKYIFLNYDSWITINDTQESERSVFNGANSGSGTVTIGENPYEGVDRYGYINLIQINSEGQQLKEVIVQDIPCMVYHFDISPTSITVPGPTSGTSGITVTSYKIMNGHTESPIPVGYKVSTGSSWLTVTGNSSPSASATTNTITYAQNPSTARNAIVTYTQNETNENGSIYNKQLTVNQEDGFIYVYKFSINSTEGATTTPSPTINLSQFAFGGGSQTVSLKSYAEVHIGSATGTIDHYEAINWSETTCNWLTVSPSSGNGTSSPTDNTTVTTTASAQSDSSSDNSRCCDITFTQATSGKKVIVHGCQEKSQTGYTYTFTIDTSSLSFEACSSTSKSANITSYRETTRNGSIISGSRVNIGYSVNTVSWATATSNSSPSANVTSTTITANSNSNNTSSRSSTFTYTQSGSNRTVTLGVSQNGATCAVYDRGPLQVNIGGGFTTAASTNVASGSTTINVSFSSPQYLSLCGISTNTKCSDGIESYKVESKPSWITSNIGDSYSTGNDVLTVSSSDVSSERTGTVVYTNGYTTASVTVTQAQGLSYTYYFKVNNKESSKINPDHETSSTLSFSNTGSSTTFTVESYRVNSISGAKEYVVSDTIQGLLPSYISLVGSGPVNYIMTYTVTLTENTDTIGRNYTLQFVQNNSGYRVDVPLTQNAATIDCFMGVWRPTVGSIPTSGGTIEFKIDSYQTVNGKQGANSSWTASVSGCSGTLNRTSGPGGTADNDSSNIVILTVPSGASRCDGTVTIINACGQRLDYPYFRIAGDVKWSDPAENTTKSVSADGITFTAYADTTGLTASDCEVTKNPTSNITVGTPQGTGTGAKAVWVEITVPANTSTDSRSWDITIAPK